MEDLTTLLDFEHGVDRVGFGDYAPGSFVFDPDNVIQLGNDVVIADDDGDFYVRFADQDADDFDASDFFEWEYSEYFF